MPAGCIFNRSVLNILPLRQRANNLSPLAVGLWASFEASPGHVITWQCRPRHLYQPKVTSNRPLRALICSHAKYNPPRDVGNWRNVPFGRKSSWLSLAAFQARRLPRKTMAAFEKRWAWKQCDWLARTPHMEARSEAIAFFSLALPFAQTPPTQLNNAYGRFVGLINVHRPTYLRHGTGPPPWQELMIPPAVTEPPASAV